MEVNKNNKKKKLLSGRFIFTVLIAAFSLTAMISSYNIMTTQVNYRKAQNEYIELRKIAPLVIHQPASPGIIETSGETEESDNSGESGDSGESSGSFTVAETFDMSFLADINPEYIGWIRINGTVVDYPIVQGPDNIKYLNTTFAGERNASGAIFMDSRNNPGFSAFALLHGHNMKDGSMFGGLADFLDPDFLTDNNEIMIINQYNDILIYTVTDALKVNMRDPIFSLPEKEPYEIIRFLAEAGFIEHDTVNNADILVLSTCTTGPRDERLIIIAVHSNI